MLKVIKLERIVYEIQNSTCDSQGRSQIKEIYETSFPKSEKFPFWVLK